MEMSYSGEDELIRVSVAEVVGTYHPTGEHGSGCKGMSDTEQRAIVAQKEENAPVI